MDSMRIATEPFVVSDRELSDLILQQTDAAIVICDKETRVVLVNPAAADLCTPDPLGKPFDEVFPMTWMQREPEGAQPDAGSFSLEPALQGENLRGLCALDCGNKPSREVYVSASPYRGPQDEFVCCIVSLMDVTAFQDAQRRKTTHVTIADVLAESKSLEQAAPRILRAMCEGLRWDLGILWHVEPTAQELRVLGSWNTEEDAALAQFAKTLPEYAFQQGEGLPGRVWAERKPRWIEQIQQTGPLPRADAAFRAGLRSVFAFPLISAGQVVGVVELYAKRSRPSEPDLLTMARVLGTQIGFFLQREEGLRGVSRLAALVHDSDDAILAKDLDGTVLDWNPAAERLYGWTREEIIGKPVTVLFPPEAGKEFEDIMVRVRRGEGVDHHDTVRMRKDGSRVHVSVTISPVRDEQGKVVGASDIMRNITERKALEQSRMAAINILNAVVEGTTDGIYVKDADGRYLMINRAGAETLSRTSENVVGKHAEDVFDPETAKRIRADDERVMALGSAQMIENTIPIQGVEKSFNTVKAPYRDSNGKIIGVIGVSRDVTQVRGAEASLARQAALLDLSPNAIIVRTLQGEITFWSRGAERLYGWQPREALGKLTQVLLQTRFPDSLRAQQTALEQVGHWEGTLQHRTRDGRTLLVASRQLVQRDENGDPVAILEINEDVTERTRIERALNDSLKRYAALIHASTQIVWTTPPDGQVVDMSEWRALTGQTVDQVSGRGWLDAIHPEDRSRTAQIWQTAVDTRTICETEFRVRLADGSYRWFSMRAVPVIDSDGNLTEWIGASSDIQEQKQAEEAQAFLVRATNVFSASLDFATTLRNIAQLAVPFLADWCAVHILEDDGIIHQLAFAHRDPAVAERQTRRPLQFTLEEGAHFLVQVLRTGIAEFYNEVPAELVAEVVRDPEQQQMLRRLGMSAYLCLPLRARGRILGTVSLVISEPGRRYGTREADLAHELIQRASLAVDNAWLYQESQASQTRLKLISEASSELLASMDYDTRLERLAQLLVPRFADWCTINLLEPNGAIRLAALSHQDPDKLSLIRQWAEEHPVGADAPLGTPNVIRTGKAEWVPDVTRRRAGWEQADPARAAYIERLNMHSYMIVPLLAGERVFGAITFVRAEGGQRYNFQDL